VREDLRITSDNFTSNNHEGDEIHHEQRK
jgi:hypothetical protein